MGSRSQPSPIQSFTNLHFNVDGEVDGRSLQSDEGPLYRFQVNTVSVRTWTTLTTFSQIFTSLVMVVFCLPFLGTDSELRARMFAAWKSYGGGLLSIDQVLEKHRAGWDFEKTIALSCCSSTEISVRYLQGHRTPIRGSRDYLPFESLISIRRSRVEPSRAARCARLHNLRCVL